MRWRGALRKKESRPLESGSVSKDGTLPPAASGMVRSNVILHDLIAIFHPEVLAENDRELFYYLRIE